MTRIIIICEGSTEQEFCKDVLQPHFNARGIYLHHPVIKKSGGGIVQWVTLSKQIQNHLSHDTGAYVTTLIDYYGINDKHQFPNWAAAKAIPDKNQRMALLENGMSDEVQNRFIPYIQLHEFEGLLFNNMEAFKSEIPQQDFIDEEELERTINNHPNPEMLNNTPENAPSYRLSRLIRGYNKIVYGSILAQRIGLAAIRGKSPRFNDWITRLENLAPNQLV